MSHPTPVNEATWIAFDTETSGKYPLGAEICEIAAIKKYPDGRVETFESLVQVSKPMGAEVIAIHGITNEMLIGAPKMDAVLPQFLEFIKDGYVVAHHAPFDLGFVTWECEKRHIPLPTKPGLCTSILSRRYILDSPNHRLQTLIDFLGLHRGAAHRALDDARACLDLLFKCFERMEKPVTVESAYESQNGGFPWPRFSIRDIRSNKACRGLVDACIENLQVEMIYGGGNHNPKRTLDALGIVRNLETDYFVGREKGETQEKRFYLQKVKDSNPIR